MLWCIYILWYLSIDCFFLKKHVHLLSAHIMAYLPMMLTCQSSVSQHVCFDLTLESTRNEALVMVSNYYPLRSQIHKTNLRPSFTFNPCAAWQCFIQPAAKQKIPSWESQTSSGALDKWQDWSLKHYFTIWLSNHQVISDELWNWINHHPLKSGSCFWFTFNIY